MISYKGALAEVRRYIAKQDVRSALQYLNSLTPHRYTGMYIFDDPVLKNQYLIDKRNPDSYSGDNVPDTATYCVFTRARRDVLSIEDSMQEERLEGHPNRAVFRSYTGVPLLDQQGDVFGTICHFDHDVVAISDQNVQLLEAIAPLLRSDMPQLP